MKNIYLILFSFFIVSCGGGDPDPSSCNSTSPKSDDDSDRYSLSDDGHPLKNDEFYAFNSGYLAGEIFNIALAQGYDVGTANSFCYRAMSTRAINNQDDYSFCDKIREQLLLNASLARSMSVNDLYKKNLSRPDGY